MHALHPGTVTAGDSVRVLLRPEALRLGEQSAATSITGQVAEVVNEGNIATVVVEITGDIRLRVAVSDPAALSLPVPGDTISVSVPQTPPERCPQRTEISHLRSSRDQDGSGRDPSATLLAPLGSSAVARAEESRPPHPTRPGLGFLRKRHRCLKANNPMPPGHRRLTALLMCRAHPGADEPEHDRCRICTTTVVIRARPPCPGALWSGSASHREAALSVGFARVFVVDELVERVDDQDRVLGMVVSRRQAIREGWLHQVAVTVCRDERGRILVHQRSEQLSRFPGLYEVVVGGAVDVGESYEQAAARGSLKSWAFVCCRACCSRSSTAAA